MVFEVINQNVNPIHHVMFCNTLSPQAKVFYYQCIMGNGQFFKKENETHEEYVEKIKNNMKYIGKGDFSCEDFDNILKELKEHNLLEGIV